MMDNKVSMNRAAQSDGEASPMKKAAVLGEIVEIVNVTQPAANNDVGNVVNYWRYLMSIIRR